MIGIIAFIISLVKGHKGYAILLICWEVVAFFLAGITDSKAIYAPGFIFLMRAIMMDNIRNDPGREQAKKEVMMYCRNCGRVQGADREIAENGEVVCPCCNIPMYNSNYAKTEFDSLREVEQNILKNKWKDSE